MTDRPFSSPTPPDEPHPATEVTEVSAPPGWYPMPEGELRYWDGTSWGERTAPAAHVPGPPADFGEKYKRRYPVVLLIWACLGGASAMAVLPPFGHRIDVSLTQTAAVFAGIGLTLVLFLTAAFWTLIAAAFKGEHRDPATPKPPRMKRAWTWALIALVAFLPLRIYEFDPIGDIAPISVASPREGCTQYLAVTLLATRNHARILNMPRYYQLLHDASTATDPVLAQDLADFVASPSEATFESSEKEILGRCLDDGNLTSAELQTWLADLKSVDQPTG